MRAGNDCQHASKWDQDIRCRQFAADAGLGPWHCRSPQGPLLRANELRQAKILATPPPCPQPEHAEAGRDQTRDACTGDWTGDCTVRALLLRATLRSTNPVLPVVPLKISIAMNTALAPLPVDDWAKSS